MKRFTLLELLIILAIIGVLITILMPSLKNAREKAGIAVCCSNQRQLSLAQFVYAKNYDEIPASSEKTTGGEYHHTYNDSTDWTRKLLEGRYTSGTDYFECPVQSFVRGENIWSERKSITVNGEELSSYLSYQQNLNHSGQGWTVPRPGAFNRSLGRVYKIPQISSDTIMYTDYQRKTGSTGGKDLYHQYSFGSAYDDNRQISTSNHNGKSATIAFFDGSAHPKRMTELRASGISEGFCTDNLFETTHGNDLRIRWNSSWLFGYWTPMDND